MTKYLILIPIFLIASCSRVETIGMAKHKFNKTPSKIVWFHVEGLDEEHLAMLRFSVMKKNSTTSIENAQCLGKSWNYNLYDLRPKDESGFLSQAMGSKNVQGQCSDFDRKPVWSHFNEQGYVTGVLENSRSDVQSFNRANKCTKTFQNLAIRWSMSKAPAGGDLFHFQEKNDFVEGMTYFDKTCQSSVCYASLEKNAKYLWKEINKNQNKVFLVIKDNSFKKALKAKKTKEARQILAELDALYGHFVEEAKSRDMLVVMSSSAARKVEFPREGKDWYAYEKSGRKLSYRRDSLLSPVFAYGSRSENFCGIYEESTLLNRFMWTPDERKYFYEYFGI